MFALGLIDDVTDQAGTLRSSLHQRETVASLRLVFFQRLGPRLQPASVKDAAGLPGASVIA